MQCSLCSCCIFSRKDKLAGLNLLAVATMTLTLKKIVVGRSLHSVERQEDRRRKKWINAVGKHLASIHVSLIIPDF